MEMKWSDRIGHRSRPAWLLLIDQAGIVHVFMGDSIPGLVAVVGTVYEKCGKWSHTIYRLELAPGARSIAGHDGWETGRFVEGLASATSRSHCDRWIDVANALGATLAETQRFLREWRSKAAGVLDQVEIDLASVETETGDVETIAISFGGPTNRVIAEGFWDWPVRVVAGADREKEVGRIVYKDDKWQSQGDIKIVALEHCAGYHGGTISMRIAAPAGAIAIHEAGE